MALGVALTSAADGEPVRYLTRGKGPAAAMAGYRPIAGSPTRVPFTAGAPITAGQLLSLRDGPDMAAPTLPHGPDDDQRGYLGVAENDAGPGEQVVVLCGGGVVHETTNNGTVDIVQPGTVALVIGANGSIQARIDQGGSVYAMPPLIGVPLSSAARGELCRWLSY